MLHSVHFAVRVNAALKVTPAEDKNHLHIRGKVWFHGILFITSFIFQTEVHE